jgi:hypothetical protein
VLLVGGVGLLATLNGCGAYNPVGTTASTTAAPLSPGTVYVADATNNQVAIFAASPGPSAGPSNQIAGSATGLNKPLYLSFDGNHTLYVANSNGSVVVFGAGATGNTAPKTNINGASTQLSQVSAVAADSLLNIYVSNVTSGGVAQVDVFPNGATGNATPSPILTGTLKTPRGLAFDACGNLYVADSGNASVAVFVAPGPLGSPSPSPSPSISGSPSPAPTGVNGLICAPGQVPTVPSTPISGAATMLQQPSDVIIDASGNVYVSDQKANAIFVYPPLGFNNTPPIRIIQGTATQLNAPTGLALDAVGDLLVANSGSGVVTVFPPLAGIFPGIGGAPAAVPTPIAVFSKSLGSALDVEVGI